MWLAPLAVAVGALRSPRGGVLVLAALLPFFGSPPGGPYRGALDVAAVIAVAGGLRSPRARGSNLSRAVVGFVLVSACSLLPLVYRPPASDARTWLGLLLALPGAQVWSALYSWRAAADLLLGWGLFVAVRRSFDRDDLGLLGRALAAGLAPVLLLGLAEHASWIDLGAYRSWPTEPWLLDRVSSVFFDSGWLAEYVVIATPLAVAALWTAGRRWRLPALALAATAVVVLALTQQRGGWISGLVQLVALLGWLVARRRRAGLRVVVGTALAAALLLAGALALSPERRTSLEERTRWTEWNLDERVDLWRAAVGMTLERPLLGVGLGDWAPWYDVRHPRGSATARTSRSTAHSTWLHVAAERGLLGLAALLLVVGSAAGAIRRAGSSEEPESRLLGRGLALALLGAAVYGFVQYLMYLDSVAWLLGLTLAAVERFDEPSGRSPLRSAAAMPAIAALLVLPLRLAAESPPLRGDRAFGFHEPTSRDGGRSFAWTEGRAVRWLRVEGSTLVLPIVNGHPAPDRRPVRVEIRLDGRTAYRAELAKERWTEVRLPIDGGKPGGALLEIEARPAFRPFREFRRYERLPRSQDPRLLGVVVGEPGWEGAPAGRASDAAGAENGADGPEQDREVDP